MKRGIFSFALLVVLTWTGLSLARPGGGQSFGGGSSRSSGGSSWSSGSPSRSGGGSSWGSRSGSGNSSPSRSPSYSSPSNPSPRYDPSPAQNEARQRTLDEATCMQRCMQPADPEKGAECQRNCIAEKEAQRRAETERASREYARATDKPMSLVLAPVLIGLAFFGLLHP